jgi:hypothetical protein
MQVNDKLAELGRDTWRFGICTASCAMLCLRSPKDLGVVVCLETEVGSWELCQDSACNGRLPGYEDHQGLSG